MKLAYPLTYATDKGPDMVLPGIFAFVPKIDLTHFHDSLVGSRP
jgi:hypothetical protein